MPPPKNIQDSLHYVSRQYTKLLILLFPALLIFFAGDFMEHKSLMDIFKRCSYLTMMANVAYPWVKCPPGVYWYFGLTFQFYLLYAFCGKYLKNTFLVWGSIITIALLGLLCSINQPELLSVYKHCFTGWFVLFAIGVFIGKQNKYTFTTAHSIVIDLLVLAISFALVILMNKWMLTWLFVPIFALVMYLSAGLLVMRIPLLFNFFKWIGRLSACIFVCHPIIRFLVNKFMLQKEDNLLVILLLYIIGTLCFSIVYNLLYSNLLVTKEKWNNR